MFVYITYFLASKLNMMALLQIIRAKRLESRTKIKAKKRIIIYFTFLILDSNLLILIFSVPAVLHLTDIGKAGGYWCTRLSSQSNMAF